MSRPNHRRGRGRSGSSFRPPPRTDRKTLQLCGQIADTLNYVLSGELDDDLLRNLYVESVRPAPDASRLLVSVAPLDAKDADRADLHAAILEGAVERVRPKMMTVAAITAGLLPILWGDGAGASVMKRIAAPMVGGMVSSTVLTLVVIPAFYALWKGGSLGEYWSSAGPQVADDLATVR